jgi:hypothetical protein
MNKRLTNLVGLSLLLVTTVLSAAGLPPAPAPGGGRGGKSPSPCNFTSHCIPRQTPPAPCHFNPRAGGCGNTMPRTPRG